MVVMFFQCIKLYFLIIDRKMIVNSASENCVYVMNYFWMDLGGGWSNKKSSFKESKSKQLYYRMLIVHIMIPIKKEHLKFDTVYLCPIYKTAERKGKLSTKGHSTKFVIAL